MATSMRTILAVAGGALLLSACAAYPYDDGYGGYWYNNGYGYDNGYAYDNGSAYGPSYYDPAYDDYGYSPGYYVGPSIGLGFSFSDRDWDRDHPGHHWRGGDRHDWHGDRDGDHDRDHDHDHHR
jgi:hypothetical protein